MFEIELNTYKFHIIQYAYLMFIAILAVYQASHFQRDQLGAIEMIKLKTDGMTKSLYKEPFSSQEIILFSVR